MEKTIQRSFTYAIAAVMLLFSCGSTSAVQAAEPESVTVFAAASTTNAINDIAKIFAEKGKGTIVPSYASSSTLASKLRTERRPMCSFLRMTVDELLGRAEAD